MHARSGTGSGCDRSASTMAGGDPGNHIDPYILGNRSHGDDVSGAGNAGGGGDGGSLQSRRVGSQTNKIEETASDESPPSTTNMEDSGDSESDSSSEVEEIDPEVAKSPAMQAFRDKEKIKEKEAREERERWFKEKMSALNDGADRRKEEREKREKELRDEKLRKEAEALAKRQADAAAYLKKLADEKAAREAEEARLAQEAAQAAVDKLREEQMSKKAKQNADWVKQKLEKMKSERKEKMLKMQQEAAKKRQALKERAAKFKAAQKTSGPAVRRQSRMSTVTFGGGGDLESKISRKSEFQVLPNVPRVIFTMFAYKGVRACY